MPSAEFTFECSACNGLPVLYRQDYAEIDDDTVRTLEPTLATAMNVHEKQHD